MHAVDRRRFLTQCAALSAGALVTRCTSPSLAIGPIERSVPGPQFKFSLAAYSYRSLLLGANPELTLSDFIQDCARMGLEGTELTSYYFPTPVTAEYLNQLKHECFVLGLDVTGTAVGNDFGFAPGPEQQQQIDQLKQWIDHAATLGAPVIRVFAGKMKKGNSEDDTYRYMVSALEECCEYAGQHGVFLALENHGGPTATADGLLRFVHDVQSPWFAVNLDTGNFHEGDIYAQIEKVAPYAVNVQVKVVHSTPEGEKPADFARLAKIMRGVGYRGYIVLEYEESGDPRTECPKYIEQLRQAFQA